MSKKITKKVATKGAAQLATLQDQTELTEPAMAVKAALKVQADLARAGVEISFDPTNTAKLVEKTPEPKHSIKVLLNSGVELEVSGTMNFLFQIIDRYAGQEHFALDKKRYGIRGTANA